MVENTSIFRKLPLGKHILYALKSVSSNLSYFDRNSHIDQIITDVVALFDIIWTIHNRYKYVNVYGSVNPIFGILCDKFKTLDNYLELSCDNNNNGFMKKNQESILIITHFNDVVHADSFSKIWELKYVSFLFIHTMKVPLPNQFTDIQYLIIPSHDYGYLTIFESFLNNSCKYKNTHYDIKLPRKEKKKFIVIDNDVKSKKTIFDLNILDEKSLQVLMKAKFLTYTFKMAINKKFTKDCGIYLYGIYEDDFLTHHSYPSTTCWEDYLYLYWLLRFYFPRELVYLILDKKIWSLFLNENTNFPSCIYKIITSSQLTYKPIEEINVSIK